MSAIPIMIIDDHKISRAAYRALLRAEGMDVIADFKATPHALTAARALNPEMVIIDVTPTAGTGFRIARGLSGLPAPVVTKRFAPHSTFLPATGQTLPVTAHVVAPDGAREKVWVRVPAPPAVLEATPPCRVPDQ
jgi:CheY-like chemotaxis protein